MADKKISALPASTTPLSGTEVLPIVQSGATKQVSVANLTAGREVLASTLNVGGTNAPAGFGSKFLVEGGDASVANAFALKLWSSGNNDVNTIKTTGTRQLSVFNNDGADECLRIAYNRDVNVIAGNLVIGTSGKGIDFSATPGAGTSELLDDYEEGTFTPTYTSTGTPPTVTYSHQYGKYTKIGRQVFFTVEIGTNSATAGTGVLAIGGLPFTSVNDRYSGTLSVGYADSFTTASPCGAYIGANSTITQLTHESSVTARTDMLTSFLTDGAGQNYLIISGSYMV